MGIFGVPVHECDSPCWHVTTNWEETGVWRTCCWCGRREAVTATHRRKRKQPHGEYRNPIMERIPDDERTWYYVGRAKRRWTHDSDTM